MNAGPKYLNVTPERAAAVARKRAETIRALRRALDDALHRLETKRLHDGDRLFIEEARRLLKEHM